MSKKRKLKINTHKPTPKAAVLPALNMGYLNAATIKTPEFKSLQFIVAGCGGIGAYMVQHIGRLMHVLYQNDLGVHMTLVDPDVVEEQNIGRQLFCHAEVGQPKAEALARRYGHAWGLNCSSWVGKYDESLLVGADLTILVGCVDNAEGRKELHETLEHNPAIVVKDSPPNIWWLDCGNLQDTGRVLLGTAHVYEQCKGAFVDSKTCIALPGPGLQSPGLLVPQADELAGSGLSCAQMAAANLQSLNINARIAAEAADMLTRLVVTSDLKRFACEVNLAAGVVRSYYATPEEVSQAIRKPVSYLSEPATHPMMDAQFNQALTEMVLRMR
jgi:PRTRC genetic system ThiF family protein